MEAELRHREEEQRRLEAERRVRELEQQRRLQEKHKTRMESLVGRDETQGSLFADPQPSAPPGSLFDD